MLLASGLPMWNSRALPWLWGQISKALCKQLCPSRPPGQSLWLAPSWHLVLLLRPALRPACGCAFISFPALMFYLNILLLWPIARRLLHLLAEGLCWPCSIKLISFCTLRLSVHSLALLNSCVDHSPIRWDTAKRLCLVYPWVLVC